MAMSEDGFCVCFIAPKELSNTPVLSCVGSVPASRSHVPREVGIPRSVVCDFMGAPHVQVAVGRCIRDALAYNADTW